ncbi:hypothetical protein ABT001_32190 [Streptomyces sp. NPDC002793]|uniref:hypothetical protein n=1 Tax=Streptomyces sp. NPDC002793 TaxID=3154432 RepID=UPI003334331B
MPLIAGASATYALQSSWQESPYHKYLPWALADAARVSLACGNEYRKDASEADLLRILDMHSQLEEPYIYEHDNDGDALARFMLRAAGEQMIYQEPEGWELARAAAMLTQTTGTREARCLRPGWEEELLGTSLSHYVGIAQLLWASAINCAGRFDPTSLEAPGAERICAKIPATTILSVAEKHFVTDTAAFRQANERAQVTTDPLLRRYEYKPRPWSRATARACSLRSASWFRPRQARWASTTPASPGSVMPSRRTWATCSRPTSAASWGCCPKRRSSRRSPTARASSASTGSSSPRNWCCWWR